MSCEGGGAVSGKMVRRRYVRTCVHTYIRTYTSRGEAALCLFLPITPVVMVAWGGGGGGRV